MGVKIKVIAKVQNFSDCLSGQYFLNRSSFCEGGKVMHHRKLECHGGNTGWLDIYRVRVTVRAHIIKI